LVAGVVEVLIEILHHQIQVLLMMDHNRRLNGSTLEFICI
jgi:hypothetical protein